MSEKNTFQATIHHLIDGKFVPRTIDLSMHCRAGYQALQLAGCRLESARVSDNTGMWAVMSLTDQQGVDLEYQHIPSVCGRVSAHMIAEAADALITRLTLRSLVV